MWHRHGSHRIYFKHVPYDNENGDGWKSLGTAETLLKAANAFRFALFHNGEYVMGSDKRLKQEQKEEVGKYSFKPALVVSWQGMSVAEAWVWDHPYGGKRDLEILYVENF
jgi:hypothetical protein